LGRACAEALVREGVNVVVNGRTADDLQVATAALRNIGAAEIRSVLGDVTAEDGRAALLAACPEPDILVNNSAGPAPKMFADIKPDEWPDAVARNMIAPLLLTRRCCRP
jgi:3-oxoacyl-[acyl-carrier protein] reductase